MMLSVWFDSPYLYNDSSEDSHSFSEVTTTTEATTMTSFFQVIEGLVDTSAKPVDISASMPIIGMMEPPAVLDVMAVAFLLVYLWVQCVLYVFFKSTKPKKSRRTSMPLLVESPENTPVKKLHGDSSSTCSSSTPSSINNLPKLQQFPSEDDLLTKSKLLLLLQEANQTIDSLEHKLKASQSESQREPNRSRSPETTRSVTPDSSNNNTITKEQETMEQEEWNAERNALQETIRAQHEKLQKQQGQLQKQHDQLQQQQEHSKLKALAQANQDQTRKEQEWNLERNVLQESIRALQDQLQKQQDQLQKQQDQLQKQQEQSKRKALSQPVKQQQQQTTLLQTRCRDLEQQVASFQSQNTLLKQQLESLQRFRAADAETLELLHTSINVKTELIQELQQQDSSNKDVEGRESQIQLLEKIQPLEHDLSPHVVKQEQPEESQEPTTERAEILALVLKQQQELEEAQRRNQGHRERIQELEECLQEANHHHKHMTP
ncbi:expressed unknown protein [Seminavis robusta]|uniref:Uncharacterized protein n=1 Tax=Seminavis robusta TaxID=568900 RepID=A0A9N8HB00_9STRA|nr:expressed unknown protein [Seminavis robusta]|eukprot:Sro165_g073910.1 n/a (491) ;mRNA; r:57829-59301